MKNFIKFSDFAKKIRPEKSNNDKREEFMKNLLISAGMNSYSINDDTYLGDEEDDDDNYSDNSLQKIYKGDRGFSGVRKKFEKKDIDTKELIKFFSKYLSNEASLVSSMISFGIPEACCLNAADDVDVFAEALCKQFEYLVRVTQEEAPNIVRTYYLNLMSKKDPQKLNEAISLHQIAESKLYRTKDEALSVVIGQLEALDPALDVESVHRLYDCVKTCLATLSVSEYRHRKAAYATKCLIQQRDNFIQCINSMNLKNEDEQSIINESILSLYSAIHRMYNVENVLKEERMLMESYLS